MTETAAENHSATPVTPVKSRRRRWPLVFSAAFALLVMGVVWAGYEFWFIRPVGEGPAEPPVPESAFVRPWVTGKVVVLGLGDSVTAGYGASPGKSFFERLVANPPDEFADMKGRSLSAVMPNLTAVNHAVSGSTSLQHVETIRRLAPFPSDTMGIIVMTTGGNDVLHTYGQQPPREGAMYGATLAQARPWIENFSARLDEMMVLLRERFPGGRLSHP